MSLIKVLKLNKSWEEKLSTQADNTSWQQKLYTEVKSTKAINKICEQRKLKKIDKRCWLKLLKIMITKSF